MTQGGIGHSLGEILDIMRRDEIAKLVGSNVMLRRAIIRVPVTPIYDTLESMYQHARATFENIETVKT